MKKSLILFIVLLILPGFINAKMQGTFDETVKSVDPYIKARKDYNIYIVEENPPYLFNGTKFVYDSRFDKGGLINKIEFDLSKDKNGETYLFDGQSYWTMTEEMNAAYTIIPTSSTLTILREKIAKSGYRQTELIENHIKVTGKGTYSNPWEFIKPEFNIRIDVVHRKNDGTEIKRELITDVIHDPKKNYDILPDTLYRLGNEDTDLSCIGDLEYEYDEINKKLRLTKVDSDVSCLVVFEPESHIVKIKVENGKTEIDEQRMNSEVENTIKIMPNENYFIPSSYSCTNGQKSSYNEGEFKIVDLSESTTCTIKFIDSLVTFTSANNEFKIEEEVGDNNLKLYGKQGNGTYGIKVYGAQGSGPSSSDGGNGAIVSGKINLKVGQVLKIEVGTRTSGGAGLHRGGGSTRVFVDDKHLVTAAGGGGGLAGTPGGNDTGEGGGPTVDEIGIVGSGINGGPGGAGINGSGGGSGYDYSRAHNCSDCKTGERYHCVAQEVNTTCRTYKSCPSCSCKEYDRCNKCLCETYRSCYYDCGCDRYEDCSSCGCASYNSWRDSGLAPSCDYNCSYDISSTSRVKCVNSGTNYWSCMNQTRSCKSYNRCPSCECEIPGTCYGRDSSCGCETYRACSSCTCKTYNTCKECGCAVWNTKIEDCHHTINTCQPGCDYDEQTHKPGKGGTSIIENELLNSAHEIGENTGNGKVEVRYYVDWFDEM